MRRATTLVHELQLSEYRWLPKALLWEFSATVNGGHVEYSLSSDLPWEARGVAPKHGSKQHEDMERNLTWLYRRHVKSPPDSKRSLQREYGIASWNAVQEGIERARLFLTCIDPPDPPPLKKP